MNELIVVAGATGGVGQLVAAKLLEVRTPLFAHTTALFQITATLTSSLSFNEPPGQCLRFKGPASLLGLC